MRHILFLPSWYPNRIYIQNGDFIQRHAEAVSLYCQVAVLHVVADPKEKTFTVERNQHKKIVELRVYFPKTSSFSPWKKIVQLQKGTPAGLQGDFGGDGAY